MKLRHAGQTDVGRRRTHNEDAFTIEPEQSLYVVADGMGGHACGEVASGMSVETIRSFFAKSAEDEEATWPSRVDQSVGMVANRLRAAIETANFHVYQQAQSDQKYRGMGTTVVGLAFAGNEAYIAHVGDSRVYRLRRGRLTLLTEDHSLLNDFKKATQLTDDDEQVRNFPHKNVILRALGMKRGVDVDVTTELPEAGDIYLLCSDGLTGEIEENEIREILTGTDDLDQACQILIESANESGGRDNITAVLVRVE